MQFSRQEVLQQLFLDSRAELESVLIRRLRCPETASDLLQEAFLRLCRNQDLEHIGNLKAYLFRIALNLVNDHFRSQKVNEIVVHETAKSLDEHADSRSQDGETQVLDEERLTLFVRALAELSPLCQRIFYLNRFDGLKHKEIARQLGVSIRTVEDNLKRALLYCGRRMEEL
ncbi:MAG: RNA polymerase sigma factor [Methylococcaceae bacterium]|nr:RNA polymerase sigma factor [Methylococcaceae bacterium]